MDKGLRKCGTGGSYCLRWPEVFCALGQAEIASFHKRGMESRRLALGSFMSGDIDDARKLLRGERFCWTEPG